MANLIEPKQNPMAMLQVIACLLKNPLLLRSEKYKFNIDDFVGQFHRIVYGAVEHLALKGLQTITVADVREFLTQYPVQYKVYTDNRGDDYVSKAMDLADENKLDYYYNLMKKHSMLNALRKEGFDTTCVYDDSLVDPNQEAEMQRRFDEMTIDDIVNRFDTKLATIKHAFQCTDTVVSAMAGDNIMELKERLKQEPSIGLPLTSPILTSLYSGQRLKKLYLESSAQGVGKTRRMIGESARLAVPKYYDLIKRKWVTTNMCNPVLYISTELELDEVQTMYLATVSGVPEHHILDGKYYDDEERRVDKAAKLIENSPLYFVQISNYDMDDIENLIKEYWQNYGVNYVYYDYLSTTIKILSEGAMKSRISNLREDQILLMFTTRLKDLCNQLGIFISTATQLSGDWKTVKEADQQLLRGAKSISDKVDIGTIMLPVRESDKDVIDVYMSKGFTLRPTHVLHIYKVRRGQHTNVRLYVYFDRSICRITDCFVTDNEGNILTDIKGIDVEVIYDQADNFGFEF